MTTPRLSTANTASWQAFVGPCVWADADATTLAWIANLESALSVWASGLDPSDDARRRLTGAARTVDQLEALANSWALEHGVDLTTYQVEARFGAYGALPVIVAVYGFAGGEGGEGGAGASPQHGFVLIDGVNGHLDGPFASGTAINPTALLAGHPHAYAAGSQVVVTDVKTGACHAHAARWRDDDPTWWPNQLLPANWPPPTNPTPWQCYSIGIYPGTGNPPTGTFQCVCDVIGTQSDAYGNFYPIRIRCDCGGTGCAGAGQPGTGPVRPGGPATPGWPFTTPNPLPDPTAPTVPANSCTRCKKQYFY